MKYSIRNFILVFILSLVIFIAAAFYCINYIEGFLDDMFGNETEQKTTAQTVTGPETGNGPDITEDPEEKKDAISFLVIGRDDAHDSADTIMLIKIDKIKKTVLITSVPTDSKLFIDGVYKKLGGTIRTHSAAFIASKVTAITGIRINYTVLVSMEGFMNIVDAAGGIDYYVPQDMKYSDPVQDLVIDLKRGNAHLDGKAALDMLRFVDYTTLDISRTALQRRFMVEVFKKFLQPGNITKLPSYADMFYENAETDFSYPALLANSDLIFSLSDYTVSNITFPGTTEIEDGLYYFIPDVDRAMIIFEPYR